MEEIRLLVGWVRARLDHDNEGGFSAVEWLIILLGTITIAGIAVAAVQAYVTSQTSKLGSP